MASKMQSSINPENLKNLERTVERCFMDLVSDGYEYIDVKGFITLKVYEILNRAAEEDQELKRGSFEVQQDVEDPEYSENDPYDRLTEEA